MSYEEQKALTQQVISIFPDAQCESLGPGGFGICAGTATIATGKHPKQAWKKAYKLIAGKNKKALEKLVRSLLGPRKV